MTLKNLPLVYAHRGASGYAVDNTFTSFDLAIKQGADGLESDVFCTKDGIPFLYHDSKIKIMKEKRIWLDKPGNIHSKLLKYVALENNETVPTFDNFLKKYSGMKNKAGDLLKISLDYKYKAAIPVARLIKKYGCEEQIYMCASSTMMFKRVRDISKKIHLVASNSIRPLTFKTFRKSWSMYKKYGIEIFNIKAADFKTEYIEKITEAGFDFYIWDLHDEKRLRKYLPYKPAGIYSNYPDLALRIRDELF